MNNISGVGSSSFLLIGHVSRSFKRALGLFLLVLKEEKEENKDSKLSLPV
jgi:hypothetical protein